MALSVKISLPLIFSWNCKLQSSCNVGIPGVDIMMVEKLEQIHVTDLFHVES
jgi:hypothetical protein